MHGAKCVVALTDAYDFLCHLDGGGGSGVKTCDEGISLASLDHHHAKIVAVEHLVVCLFECVTLALALLCENLCIAFAAFSLVVVTEVDDLDAIKTQFEFFGKSVDAFIVTKENWLADALGTSLYGCLHHCGMNALGKDHSLWMLACCVIEFLCHLGLLTEQLTKVVFVGIPIGNLLASHSTLHGSKGNC